MVDSFKELGEVLISIRDEIRGVRALLTQIDDKLDKAGAASLAAVVAAPAEKKNVEETEPVAEKKPEAALPDVSEDFASFAVELQEGAETPDKVDLDDFVVSGDVAVAEPEPESAAPPPAEINSFPMELLAQAASDEPALDAAEAKAPVPEAPPSDDDLINLLTQVAPARPTRAREAGSAAEPPPTAPAREEKVSTDKFDLSSAELDEILKG